jgi:predicted PurR-regulated permease PerM
MSGLLDSIHRHRQALFALLAIALVAWLLWSARGALPVFFIGLALVFVLDPAVTRLARAGVPRWAGVIVMYVVVVGVVWGLVAYALPPITAQARELVDALPRLGAALAEWEQGLEEWYANLPLPAEIREMIDEQLAAGGQALAELLQALLAPTVTALLRAATFILGLVVIPVWLFYVLKDREGFGKAVAGGMPPGWRADIGNMLDLLGRVGGRWVRGQLLLGAAIFVATVIGLGFLVAIGFTDFGEFILILALIAGVLEWFPIIGPIVAAIPAILIGLSISLPAAIAAALLYIVIQQLENHLLVPKVMGDAVDLHPAVLVMALVIGGALFGIGGAILAAPVVAAGRDLYRYGFHRFGGRPPAEAFELALHGPRPPPPGPPEAPPTDPPSGPESSPTAA